jgi:hypothetical protein
MPTRPLYAVAALGLLTLISAGQPPAQNQTEDTRARLDATRKKMADLKSQLDGLARQETELQLRLRELEKNNERTYFVKLEMKGRLSRTDVPAGPYVQAHTLWNITDGYNVYELAYLNDHDHNQLNKTATALANKTVRVTGELLAPRPDGRPQVLIVKTFEAAE